MSVRGPRTECLTCPDELVRSSAVHRKEPCGGLFREPFKESEGGLSRSSGEPPPTEGADHEFPSHLRIALGTGSTPSIGSKRGQSGASGVEKHPGAAREGSVWPSGDGRWGRTESRVGSGIPETEEGPQWGPSYPLLSLDRLGVNHHRAGVRIRLEILERLRRVVEGSRCAVRRSRRETRAVDRGGGAARHL